jgi:dTDP-4-dehydrorhamnose 3,5-epimerase
MIFSETALPGVFIVDIERNDDERGFFARTACVDEFASHGLPFHPVQANVSWNIRKGTVRGLHYQVPPYAEAKLVRCTAGAIYDVLVDIRLDSPTCGRWIAVELDADNRRGLLVSEGIAQGFQTLVDGTEVFYELTARYNPDSARGIRWNDPALGIDWPLRDIVTISDRDSGLPDLATALREAQ